MSAVPVLGNNRQERFCNFLAQGKCAVDAHELACYKRNDGNASTLLAMPHIQDRLKEIRGELARNTVVTAESLIQQAEEVRLCAMERRQFSAAIAAIREIGVLSGARIERREVGAPGEFDGLTDAELERGIVERLRVIGLRVGPIPDGKARH
jgi:phage terminase small subunit